MATNYLSVFDHFVGLVLKGLNWLLSINMIKESILKFNEHGGWTEDTLDCCRKILQPPNIVKFIFFITLGTLFI